MKVAVIGAGVSGLFAIKSCLEEGLEPTCFEKTDQIGGLWVYREASSSTDTVGVYADIKLNTSSFSNEASDFPATYPELFPSGKQHLSYFHDYARHYDLERCIHFNSYVLSVVPIEDLWEVVSCQNGHDKRREVFDAVLVCSGLYSKPVVPRIEGKESFKGVIVTSNDFKHGQQEFVRNKRVLVLGSSISAGNLSGIIAPVADKLYMSVGGGCSLVQSQVMGWPFDPIPICRARLLGERRMLQLNKIMTFPEQHHYGITTHDADLMTRPFLMTLDDEMASLIKSGKIQIKPELVRLDESNHAWFDNGESVQIDTLITCKGYNRSMPFLSNNIVAENSEDMELYRLMWPLTTGKPNLAFIGMVRVFGTFTPYLELQARYAVQVIQGNCRLPSDSAMKKEINDRKRAVGKGSAKLHKPTLVYQDHMAREIGCLPQWRDYFPWRPLMALMVAMGPAFPCTYRLVGPHASQEAERRARQLWWRWLRLMPLRAMTAWCVNTAIRRVVDWIAYVPRKIRSWMILD